MEFGLSRTEKQIGNLLLIFFLICWVGPFLLNLISSIDGVSVGLLGSFCVFLVTFGFVFGHVIGRIFHVSSDIRNETNVKGDLFSLLVIVVVSIAAAAAAVSLARVVIHCGGNPKCFLSMGRNYEKIFLLWTPINYLYFLLYLIPIFLSFYGLTHKNVRFFVKALFFLVAMTGGVLAFFAGNKMIPTLFVLFCFGSLIINNPRRAWKFSLVVGVSMFFFFYSVHSMRLKRVATFTDVVNKVGGYMVYNFKNFENFIDADLKGTYTIEKSLVPNIFNAYFSRYKRVQKGDFSGRRRSFKEKRRTDSLLHNKHYNAKTFVLGAYSWMGFMGLLLLPMLHGFLQMFLTKKLIRGTNFIFTTISIWLVLFNIMILYFFNYHFSRPLYHYVIAISFLLDLAFLSVRSFSMSARTQS